MMPMGAAKLSVRTGYDELANRSTTTTSQSPGRHTRFVLLQCLLLEACCLELKHHHAGIHAMGSSVGLPGVLLHGEVKVLQENGTGLL